MATRKSSSASATPKKAIKAKSAAKDVTEPAAKPKSFAAWLRELESRWQAPGSLPELDWPKDLAQAGKQLVDDRGDPEVLLPVLGVPAAVSRLRALLDAIEAAPGNAESAPEDVAREWSASNLSKYMSKRDAIGVVQLQRGWTLGLAGLALRRVGTEDDQRLLRTALEVSLPEFYRVAAASALVGVRPMVDVTRPELRRLQPPAAGPILIELGQGISLAGRDVRVFSLRVCALHGLGLADPTLLARRIDEARELAKNSDHVFDAVRAALLAALALPSVHPDLKAAAGRCTRESWMPAAQKLIGRVEA